MLRVVKPPDGWDGNVDGRRLQLCRQGGNTDACSALRKTVEDELEYPVTHRCPIGPEPSVLSGLREGSETQARDWTAHNRHEAEDHNVFLLEAHRQRQMVVVELQQRVLGTGGGLHRVVPEDAVGFGLRAWRHGGLGSLKPISGQHTRVHPPPIVDGHARGLHVTIDDLRRRPRQGAQHRHGAEMPPRASVCSPACR